jgi:hypothetical protein
MVDAHFKLASAFNSLGEVDDPVLSTDLIENVTAHNDISTAYQAYAKALSKQIEEPLREYHRIMHSIRMAVLAREEAWTTYINAKSEVVSARDRLSKSVMLSKVIGVEGREELMDTRAADVDRALQDESVSKLALDTVQYIRI